MFSAIGKLFRALGYLLTGRIDMARKTLSLNPAVMQANYDEIIKEKQSRIQQYQKAVGGLIATQETKKEKLRKESEEANHFEQLKAGAKGKAKAIADTLNNDANACRNNAEYQKCKAAHNDFASTLDEKNKLISELETDITGLQKQIDTHQITMTSLLREIDKLKSEKHEAVADVIASKQEKEIADMFNGISEDRTAKELQELRELRTQARAEARVAREVGGVSAKTSETDFLAYATNTKHEDDFEKSMGLKESSPMLDAVIQATEANKANKESV